MMKYIMSKVFHYVFNMLFLIFFDHVTESL